MQLPRACQGCALAVISAGGLLAKYFGSAVAAQLVTWVNDAQVMDMASNAVYFWNESTDQVAWARR